MISAAGSRYVFSAKGAVIISAWGVAPGIGFACKQALKARFNSCAESMSRVNRAFSAGGFESAGPGALPQASNETAPLVLDKTENRGSLSLVAHSNWKMILPLR